jgi:hypothetical protein
VAIRWQNGDRLERSAYDLGKHRQKLPPKAEWSDSAGTTLDELATAGHFLLQAKSHFVRNGTKRCFWIRFHDISDFPIAKLYDMEIGLGHLEIGWKFSVPKRRSNCEGLRRKPSVPHVLVLC